MRHTVWIPPTRKPSERPVPHPPRPDSVRTRTLIIEAYEKAQSPRARELLALALAHEHGDPGHQTGDQSEDVEQATHLPWGLVSESHQHYPSGEKQEH